MNENQEKLLIMINNKIQFTLDHLRAPPLTEGIEPIHQISPIQKY